MNNQINRIYTPIIIAIALLIGIVLLRPTYTQYMDAKTEQRGVKATQEERQKILGDLSRLQTSFQSASGSTLLIDKVKKLDKKWNEAAILKEVMLTEHTKSTQIISAPIEIQSISISKGNKLPSGLSLGTVQMTITGQSVDAVVSFLTYLTTNSQYVFTLDSINLPLSAPAQRQESTSPLSISLGVYYFE